MFTISNICHKCNIFCWAQGFSFLSFSIEYEPQSGESKRKKKEIIFIKKKNTKKRRRKKASGNRVVLSVYKEKNAQYSVGNLILIVKIISNHLKGLRLR